MKSLEQCLQEIKKINEENIKTPIFDFEHLTITFRDGDKRTENFENTEDFEISLRNYIIIHYQGLIQRIYWSQYDFPLNMITTEFEEDEKERTKLNSKIDKIWNKEVV